MATGFYVPNSISSNYVSNIKTNEGDYKYDKAVAEVGLSHQAALASISKDYSTTINKAYSDYLSANRAIRGSAMGQGYKEAYLQANQEALAQEVAQDNLNAANARYQLASSSQEAIGNISSQFKQEVSNMDKVAYSAKNYLEYLKTLTGANNASQTYLSEEQMNMSLDNMYDVLFNAQPQGYLDAEGNPGMSYIQWINANLKDTEADKEWAQWLFGQGGYTQFVNATKKGIKSL